MYLQIPPPSTPADPELSWSRTRWHRGSRRRCTAGGREKRGWGSLKELPRGTACVLLTVMRLWGLSRGMLSGFSCFSSSSCLGRVSWWSRNRSCSTISTPTKHSHFRKGFCRWHNRGLRRLFGEGNAGQIHTQPNMLTIRPDVLSKNYMSVSTQGGENTKSHASFAPRFVDVLTLKMHIKKRKYICNPFYMD